MEDNTEPVDTNTSEVPIASDEQLDAESSGSKRKASEVDSIEDDGPETKKQKVDDVPPYPGGLTKREDIDIPKYLAPLPVANVKKPILLGANNPNNSKNANNSSNNSHDIVQTNIDNNKNQESIPEEKQKIIENQIPITASDQSENNKKAIQTTNNNIENNNSTVKNDNQSQDQRESNPEKAVTVHNQKKESNEVTQDSNEDIIQHLSLTIFPTSSVDSITKLIGDFIFKYGDRPNVEIEAKFGFVIDKQSNQRIRLPIKNEACINPQVVRFESYVHLDIFKKFNRVMNDKFSETKKQHYKGPQMQYQVQIEVDQFDSAKNRRTVNEKREVVRCIKKTRLDNLDVYCPNNILDFRISATIEEKVPDLTSNVQYERKKHRISYAYSLWQFDVTSVETNEKSTPKNTRGFYQEFQKSSGSMLDQVNYEIEVECRNMPFVLEQRDKVFKKQANQFSATVQSLVSNLRAVNGMLGLRQ